MEVILKKAEALLILKSSLGELFQAQKKLLLVEIASFGNSNFVGGMELVKQLREKGFLDSDDEMKQVVASFLMVPTSNSPSSSNQNVVETQKQPNPDKLEVVVTKVLFCRFIYFFRYRYSLMLTRKFFFPVNFS